MNDVVHNSDSESSHRLNKHRAWVPYRAWATCMGTPWQYDTIVAMAVGTCKTITGLLEIGQYPSSLCSLCI